MPSGGSRGIVPLNVTDPGCWPRAVQPDRGYAIRGFQGDRPPQCHRPGVLAEGRATRSRVCHQGVPGGSSPSMPQTRVAGRGPCNPTAGMPSGGSRGIVPLNATDPGCWPRAVQPDRGYAIRGFEGDRPPQCHCHQGVRGGSSLSMSQTRVAGCGPCNPTAGVPPGGSRGIVPLNATDPGCWLRAAQRDGGDAIRGFQGDRPLMSSSPSMPRTRDAGCGPRNAMAGMPSGGSRGIVPLMSSSPSMSLLIDYLA